MIILTGRTNAAKWERIYQERGNMGMLLSPDQWCRPWWPTYACDNDAFAHREDALWWKRRGERRWLQMLDKIPLDMPPLFVLLPDVVGDWGATYWRAQEYLREVRERGLPVAIALQDGCIPAEAMSIRPHYVFIGGTRRWKWTHAERLTDWFHRQGVKVHIGRVNGPRKIREALRVGADSVDGSGLNRFSNEMLPPVFNELDGRYEQLRLGI